MQTLDDLQRNLNYKIKAQEIGLASWKGSHGSTQKMTIPTKDFLLNSASRQQDIIKMRNDMVEDYLDNQKIPIKAYDEFGEVIGEYKYHNIPPPDLNYNSVEMQISTLGGIRDIKVEPNEFNEFIGVLPDLANNMSLQYTDEILRLQRQYEDEERELLDFKSNFLINSKSDLDTSLQERKYIIDNNPALSENQKRKQKLNLLGQYKEEYKQIKEDYKNGINRYTQIMTYLKDGMTHVNNNRLKTENEILELRAKIQKEMKSNEEKVKNYAQELNNLNKGELSTSKNFNETDEEYLQRLQDMAAVPYADARSEAKALSREKEKLRENMKLIIRSNSTIDQVVNSLYANEPLLIYQLNKYFNGFKEYFIKKFGSDNDKIDFREIIREIGFYLKRATDPNILKGNVINPSEIAQKVAENLPLVPYQRTGDIIPPLSSEVILPETQSEFLSDMFDIINKTEETLGELKESAPSYLTGEEESENLFNIELIPPLVNNTLVITNSKGKKIYLKWSRKNFKIKNGQEFKAPIFYFSESGNPGTFYDIDYRAIIDKLSSLFNVSKLEIYKLFGKRGDYRKFTKDDLELGLSSRGLLPTFDDPRVLKKNPVTIGYGIKHAQDIPEKVNFGSNILLLKKLFLKNILSIQNKHNTKINGFNNVNVSDNFVKIIMNLLKNIDFTNNDLQNLSNGERILLDNLLTLSELNKKFVTGSNINSLNQLKKEYEILIGEIEAGNNNELLKKKLYTLLMKFVHFGALSQLQARKQYKEIIKDYF